MSSTGSLRLDTINSNEKQLILTGNCSCTCLDVICVKNPCFGNKEFWFNSQQILNLLNNNKHCKIKEENLTSDHRKSKAELLTLQRKQALSSICHLTKQKLQFLEPTNHRPHDNSTQHVCEQFDLLLRECFLKDESAICAIDESSSCKDIGQCVTYVHEACIPHLIEASKHTTARQICDCFMHECIPFLRGLAEQKIYQPYVNVIPALLAMYMQLYDIKQNMQKSVKEHQLSLCITDRLLTLIKTMEKILEKH